jgi:hypothetical protein
MKCRTAELGGHIKVCEVCGKVEISYVPCKDRHCPKCGAFEKAEWLEEQKGWLLPIHYYHVIFTIDHVFNPLVWWNKKKMYNLVCRVAAEVLKAYGQRYMGGEIGFTTVLHTWGQTMQAHPHVHAMVTGGARVTRGREYEWRAGKKTYMLPAEEFSADFRKAFCERVKKMWQRGELESREGELDVEAMLKEAEGKKWEVYIQTPKGEVRNLLDYLGRYIFRIAISNHRIIEVKKGLVRFEYYDNRDDGKLKVKTLTAVEFIRRFLLHVLPKRFQRIRHYGLHHSSQRKKIEIARRLLGVGVKPRIVKLELREWLQELLGEDPTRCPHCGEGRLVVVRKIGPTKAWRVKLAPLMFKIYRWGWGY